LIISCLNLYALATPPLTCSGVQGEYHVWLWSSFCSDLDTFSAYFETCYILLSTGSSWGSAFVYCVMCVHIVICWLHTLLLWVGLQPRLNEICGSKTLKYALLSAQFNLFLAPLMWSCTASHSWCVLFTV